MPESGWSRRTTVVRVGELSEIHVPYRSAAEWIETLDGGPMRTLIGLARETSSEYLLESMAAGLCTSEELASAAYDLYQQAIPFKWWEGYRLLAVSAQKEVMGRIALAGLDPYDMTAGVWCCAVYSLLTKDAEAKDKFKFDAQLSTPPDGIEDDDWGDNSFDTMVAQARAMPGMR